MCFEANSHLCGCYVGMGAGLPKYNTINLEDLSIFSAEEEVTLEKLESFGLLNLSGRNSKLPLKVKYHNVHAVLCSATHSCQSVAVLSR